MASVLKVKATLMTRCGCWKQVDVPYPPGPQVIVALKPRPVSLYEQSEDLAKPRMEARHFDLIDCGGSGDNAWATYEERP
jgi:hypothetical protein